MWPFSKIDALEKKIDILFLKHVRPGHEYVTRIAEIIKGKQKEKRVMPSKRTVHVRARVSPEERAQIKGMCEASGKNMSQIIRECLARVPDPSSYDFGAIVRAAISDKKDSVSRLTKSMESLSAQIAGLKGIIDAERKED